MAGKLENISVGNIYPGIKFVNESEDFFISLPVFHRVMSLEAVLRILEPKKLNFTSPLKWEDPFEHFPFTHVKNRVTLAHAKELEENVFAVCMTYEHVTEAHWITYTKSDIPVEIEFYPRQYLSILNELKDKYFIFVGKVNYDLPDEEIMKMVERNVKLSQAKRVSDFDWFASLLFFKREDFRHENEMRVVLIRKPQKLKDPKSTKKSKENPEEKKTFITEPYTCSDQELIRGIMFGPKTPEHTYNLLEDVFHKKYGFKGDIDEEKVITKKVRKSPLYRKLGEEDSKNAKFSCEMDDYVDLLFDSSREAEEKLRAFHKMVLGIDKKLKKGRDAGD